MVKLVSCTVPKIHPDIVSPEDLIVYCARVSNPSNQCNTETGPKLLKYLIKNEHWSPMEMASMCVDIKTSRAIAAQLLRHRSFSFQEFSMRYSDVNSMEYIEWRLQGTGNRMVGEEVLSLSNELSERVTSLQKECIDVYNDLLKQGYAKECSRMILPLNSSTTLYMYGSVRSWIHYIGIRTKANTMKEHRIIALKIRDIFIENFPMIAEACDMIPASPE